MSLRPVDLPELRAEAILRQASDGAIMRAWAEHAHPQFPPNHSARTPEFARVMWRRELERLGSAELYFVSSEMTRLAIEAAKSIPSFCVDVADLPGRNGLIVFDGGLPNTMHHADGSPQDTHAVLWTSVGESLNVSAYIHRDDLLSRARENGAVQAEQRLLQGPRLVVNPRATFGTILGERGWQDPPERSTVRELLPALVATWLLMQQPIAEVTEAVVDRAARKRLIRAGREPAPIRVIHLRRPANTSGAGMSDREYHHQWIVRGHWRQQWYPAREVHRPVWIAPHIKGPEGAPLIGGEKVYAWTR